MQEYFVAHYHAPENGTHPTGLDYVLNVTSPTGELVKNVPLGRLTDLGLEAYQKNAADEFSEYARTGHKVCIVRAFTEDRQLTLTVSIGCLDTEELEAFKRITEIDKVSGCCSVLSKEYFNGLSLDERLNFNKARDKYNGMESSNDKFFESAQKHGVKSGMFGSIFTAQSFLQRYAKHADRIREARPDEPPIVETVAPEAAGKVKATNGGKNTTRKGHVDVDVVCEQIVETKMPLCRIEKANGMGKGSLSRPKDPLIITACRMRKARTGNKGTKIDGIADRECYDDEPED